MCRHPDLTVRRTRGFSLVELMVAITIGLVVLAAVVTVLVNSKQNYTVQDSLARLQENARFAVNTITRDLRLAGHFGCSDDLSTFKNHLNPTPLLSTTPLEGLEDGGPTFYPTGINISALVNPAGNIKLVPNSDAFVARFMEDGGLAVTPPYMNTNAAALHVEKNGRFKQNDIVLVADCQSADMFQISNANPDSGTIVHNEGVGSPGNAEKDLSKIYEENSFVGRLNAVSYFIATNDDRPGRPGLYRKIGIEDAQEMVEGVENMQILYGEVTDGNRQRSPTVYVTANNVINWSNVVSARIGLLVYTLASESESGESGRVTDKDQQYDVNGTVLTSKVGSVPANDEIETKRVKRRVFTTTVSLRNVR